MKNYLSIILLLALAFTAKAQDQETFVIPTDVNIDSEEYKELKLNGELNSGLYNIVNPNAGVSEHVTVYPENTAERDGPCDCWIEPDDTYSEANFAANGTDDGSTAEIDFTFDFNLYGDVYSSFWINTNGNITFDGANGTYTASGFPANVVMLAPFWADVDFGCADCGTLYYKITEEAVYVNWVEVGYFNEQSDKVNSFQVIFTRDGNDVLTEGNNVQYCYGDMQWTTGSASGGSNGFAGTPATVGANAGDNTNYIQFGRFDHEGTDFDGSVGNSDGVSWLDGKTLEFSTDFSVGENIPPIAAGLDFCETIVMCSNETEVLNFTFLAPEQDQNITIEVEDVPELEMSLTVTEGSDASVELFITTSEIEEAAFYTFIITATDDGVPAASTSLEVNVEIIPVTVPDISITSEGMLVDTLFYCQGSDGVTLDTSPGFDSLLWSNNYEEISGDFEQGTYYVTGYFDQCDTEAGPVTVFQIPVYNPPVSVFDNLLCNDEVTTVAVQNPAQFDNFSWEVSTTGGGTILSDPTESSIEVQAGVYVLTVIDENDCPGTAFAVVNEEIVEIPETNFNDFCDDDDEVFWSGAWANPNSCGQNLQMFDAGGDTWEGAYLEVFVDGVGPFTYSITSGFGQVLDGVDAIHGQIIDYYFYSGLDDDDIDLTLWDSDNVEVFNTQNGDVLTSGGFPFFTQIADCGFNAVDGEWTVDGPAGWEMQFDDVFNPVLGANSFTAPEDYVGVYNLTFNSELCEVEETFALTFNETPTVTAFDYFDNCEGESVLIEPEYGTDEVIDLGVYYIWDPGLTELVDGQATNTVTQSVLYTIRVGNESCGESEDSGVVEFIPIPNPSLTDITICDNASALLDPENPDHASFEYAWTGNGIADPSASEITVSDAGTYDVTVRNNCGTASASATVSLNLSPSVISIDSLAICPGTVEGLAPIWSDGVTSANWSFTWLDTLGNIQIVPLDATSPAISFGADQIDAFAVGNNVTINYSSANTCGVASGSTVAFIDACYLSATNVFSPDNDSASGLTNIPGATRGMNETWYILGIDGINNVDVKIFNRWGALVYENASYKNTKGWDGSNSNGNDLEDGVYFYNVTVPNRDEELRGTVTLLRKK